MRWVTYLLLVVFLSACCVQSEDVDHYDYRGKGCYVATEGAMKGTTVCMNVCTD
jgi:hypothetical protein